MKQEFYVLWDLYYKFSKLIPYPGGEYERYTCSNCGAISIKDKRPIKVYFKGKKKADYYRDGILSVVSKTFQEIFKENGIRGYELKNIESHGWFEKGTEVPLNISTDDLKELVVTGRCGFLCHKDGTLIKKCDLCNSPDYEDAESSIGLSFNPDDWDGTDIFAFDNWRGNIIVTSKVKELIEKEKLTNMEFIKLEEFDFNC